MTLQISPVKPLRWQRHRYSTLARQRDIFASAAKLVFYLWWDRTIARDTPHHRYRRAQWLVGTLLDLGPTFIKIGQALSTRADLLPKEYVKALGRLQDQVPAFSAEAAIAIIEAELGNSIHTLFRDFDRVPLAAASLGQVHRARLHTGEEVVIKVQRPGLAQLFELDFKVLARLILVCQRLLPWTRQYELEAIYQEFFQILYQEIDYLQEGKNADRFRENFSQYPRIVVPKIHWRYTSHKVLAMEYVPGIKVDDRQTIEACGLNAKEINQLGICCYLKQLLQDGFFQADPHPGNMAVSQDGSLIFYDFGMMAEVKSLAKDQMVKTFFAVLKKDTDEVLNTLISMGLVRPVPDMTPVRRLVAFTLDKFTEKPIDVKAFGEMKSELYSMFEQQPFRLPAQMTFILKALTTLDGIARTLDPQYSPVGAAKPFIKSLAMAKGQGNLFGELTRQAKDLVKTRLNQPSNTEILLRRLEERIERGELQIQARSPENDRALKQLNLAVRSLIYACLTGFTLLSGAVLLLGPYSGWAIVAFSLSSWSFVILLRSLINLSVQEKLDKFVQK